MGEGVRVRVTAARWSSPGQGIDDPRWSDVPSGRLVDLSGGQLVWPTEFRLAWEAERLWVAFACSARSVRATMTRYKDKVWQEDAVEVYVQPPDGLLCEFQLSPRGVFRDLVVRRPGEPDQEFDDSWCCAGMRTDALIADERGLLVWRAVMGIPWSSVSARGPVAPGWKLGLFRLERDPEELSALCASPAPEVDFHDPRLLADLALAPRESG
jgi:hypothetical protein